MSARKLLLCFSLLWGSGECLAAACCGGSVAAPAMIIGDDRAQVSLGWARTDLTDDVYTDGTWRSREVAETTTTWSVEGAHIFADRWQVGASVPVVRREFKSSSSSGFGDVATNLGYEYLPDWDYNLWRPKGLGFLQLIAPTGKAIQNSTDAYQLDARGRGFWALGVGTILSKTVGRWDGLISLSIHRAFARAYSNTLSSGTLHPGWGTAASAGLGYNWQSFRVGGAIAFIHEDAIEVTGSEHSQKGAPQRQATGTVALGYTPNDDWSTALSWQDQTWFGSPSNTTLGRGLQLTVQHHFSR